MSRPHPRRETNREADDRQHQRRAQVGFLRHQAGDNTEHHEAWQERSPERIFVAGALIQESRQKQHEHKLRDLRGLN